MSLRIGPAVLSIVFAASLVGALPLAAQSSDEAAIRSLDRQWVQKVQEGDADWIAERYAEDGRLMPPNSEAAVGRDAIRDAWAGMVQAPLLTFSPDVVEVSASGDMAYDIGSYRLQTEDQDGTAMEDHGKYVVVWVKRDGDWQVAADIFNSSVPADAM